MGVTLVPEVGLLPACVFVAMVAGFPHVAMVCVVLAMTSYTRFGGAHIPVGLVATGAFGLQMLVLQHKGRLVMVKRGFTPGL